MVGRKVGKTRLAKKNRAKSAKKQIETEKKIDRVLKLRKYGPGAVKLRLKKTGSGGSAPVRALSRTSQMEMVKKKKSALLKRQAQERIALRDHTADLEARRQRIRRGENAKAERRELGKYIRKLKEEQKVKHVSEIQNIETELARLVEAKKLALQRGLNEEEADWEDLSDQETDETVLDELRVEDADELTNLFANLLS